MRKTKEVEATHTVRIADATCGMNRHPALLLQALAQEELEVPVGAWFRTEPFLNCREQGFVLKIRNSKGTELSLAFFTHRNSDELCALRWIGGRPHISGGVRPDEVPTEAFPDKWTHAATWPYLEISAPMEWIADQIENHIADSSEAPE